MMKPRSGKRATLLKYTATWTICLEFAWNKNKLIASDCVVFILSEMAPHVVKRVEGGGRGGGIAGAAWQVWGGGGDPTPGGDE